MCVVALRQEPAEDVSCVTGRVSHKAIDLFDSLHLEEFLVRGVAHEHQGLVKALGELEAAFAVGLDDGAVDVVVGEKLSEVHGLLARTAGDHHAT